MLRTIAVARGIVVNRGLVAASFAPTDIAGLVLWLKADSLVLNDADPVATWTAAAGTNPTAAGSKQPTYKVNIQNGKPVVRFDGTDDVMQTSFAPGSVGLTFFYVCRTGATIPTNQVVLGSGGAGGSADIRWAHGPSGDLGQRNGWAGAVADVNLGGGGAYAADTAYLLTYYTDKSNWVIRRNGVAGSNIADTSFPSATFNAFLGGENGTPNYPLKGDIGEILVYDTTLSGANISVIELYLNQRWAVY